MKEFFKNLSRYKVSFTLNILGLAIVLAVTSAIVLARSWKAVRENSVNALYKE